MPQRRNCRTEISYEQIVKDQRIRKWKLHVSKLNGLQVIQLQRAHSVCPDGEKIVKYS